MCGRKHSSGILIFYLYMKVVLKNAFYLYSNYLGSYAVNYFYNSIYDNYFLMIIIYKV